MNGRGWNEEGNRASVSWKRGELCQCCASCFHLRLNEFSDDEHGYRVSIRESSGSKRSSHRSNDTGDTQSHCLSKWGLVNYFSYSTEVHRPKIRYQLSITRMTRVMARVRFHDLFFSSAIYVFIFSRSRHMMNGTRNGTYTKRLFRRSMCTFSHGSLSVLEISASKRGTVGRSGSVLPDSWLELFVEFLRERHVSRTFQDVRTRRNC